jgi:hypothetical protein
MLARSVEQAFNTRVFYLCDFTGAVGIPAYKSRANTCLPLVAQKEKTHLRPISFEFNKSTPTKKHHLLSVNAVAATNNRSFSFVNNR